MAGPNMSVADFSAFMDKSIKGEFARIFEDSYWKGDDWRKLVKLSSSDGDTETYGFGGVSPLPDRVDNNRFQEYGFDDESYELKNRKFGKTLVIQEDVWADDRHGYLRDKAKNAARGFEILLPKQAAEHVVAGISTACHDGQFFFDTDHTTGLPDGNQSNDDQNQLVSTASMNTAVTAISTVDNAMKAFKDGHGVFLGMSIDTIMCGPGVTADAFNRVISSPQLPGTANNDGNPYFQKLNVIVNPYITSASAWYGFDTKIYKPLLFQDRTGLVTHQSSPGSDSEFFKNRYYMRYRWGYGPWFTGIMGDA